MFYYDSEKKESTWDCPEEIEGIVEAMEAAELADAKDTMDAVTSEGPLGADMDMPGSPLGTKRKVREEEEGEYGADKPPAGKRKKREGEASEREKGKKTIGVEDAVEDEEDEEAWQRRLAEEMADEEGVNSAQENEKESAMEEMEAVPRVPLEEATQLFRVSALQSLDLCHSFYFLRVSNLLCLTRSSSEKPRSIQCIPGRLLSH